jgi:hypothetical protein
MLVHGLQDHSLMAYYFPDVNAKVNSIEADGYSI